ncbi:hypothetical protein REPUB_Repub05bG0206000 [Reevesia pubescens]
MICVRCDAGFTIVNIGCCGTVLLEASFLCNSPTPPCPTPSEFMFWDSIHPSEAAYKALTEFLENQIEQDAALNGFIENHRDILHKVGNKIEWIKE